MTIYKEKCKLLINTIFSSKWKYGTKILHLIIFLSFSFIASYNLFKGFVMSSDSIWYSDAAEDLIELNFNLFKYYSLNTHTIPSFFYTLPVFLIALSKLLFGTEWQNAFMSLNLILVFFSTVLFSKSLLLLNVRPLVISIAICILTLSADLLTWPRYILTDMIFSFLVVSIFYLMIKNIINNKNHYILITLIILLMFLTRPTSIIFIFSIIIFIVLLKFKINYNPKFVSSLILLSFIFIPLILTLSYIFMKFYMSANPKISFIIQLVEAGIIIYDRPETWIKKPDTFFEILNFYFIKMIYFFTPYIKSFSIIHIVFNLIQSIIILISIFIWLFLGEKYNSINKTITLVLLTTILVSGFHSFTLIDYDFRYRFPVIIPLLIIFPQAFEIFLTQKLNKIT